MDVHASGVRMPQFRRERACARLARISTSRRMASTLSDRFSFSKTGSLSSSNRPCHSFILIDHQPGSHRCRQAEQVNETFGVMMIVGAGIKRCDVLSVQAEWRNPALYGHRALVQRHRHRTGDDFLRLFEERVKSLAERREPLAFIN